MANKIIDEIKNKIENFNCILHGMIPKHLVIQMLEEAKIKYPENEKEIKAYLQGKDKETIIELYLQKEFDHKVELESKDNEIKEWIEVRDYKNKVINKQSEKIRKLKKQLAEKEKELKENL